MPDRSRRHVLRLCGATSFGFLAGCQVADEEGTPGATRPTDTATRSTATPTPTSSPPGTATATPAASPEDLLPEETDGWTLERTGQYDWTTIGGAEGVRGYYTDADGVAYEVLIMRMETGSPEAKVEHWTCEVGWSVGLAYEEFAIAAGTGTVQRTFTPERPPTMERTPIPDTTETARALLANSPALTKQLIDGNAITARDC